MSQPKVSVLMSVRNGEAYLRSSIESILTQTFQDFEFLILDDASDDRTPAILSEYGRKDARIRLFRNNRNLGLTRSLNKLIDAGKGLYIARQDADDISMVRRLEKQVAVLNSDPGLGVCGVWVDSVNTKGEKIGSWHSPTDPSLIPWHLCFQNCISHPSVMFRKRLVESDAYRSEVCYGQDYDLWVRLSVKTRLMNIPETLYLRRRHAGMIGVRHKDAQDRAAREAMRKAISRYLDNEASSSMIQNLQKAARGIPLEGSEEVKASTDLILRLYRAFVKKTQLDLSPRNELRRDTAFRLARLATTNSSLYPSSACRAMWRATVLGRKVPALACLKILRGLVVGYVSKRI